MRQPQLEFVIEGEYFKFVVPVSIGEESFDFIRDFLNNINSETKEMIEYDPVKMYLLGSMSNPDKIGVKLRVGKGDVVLPMKKVQ